MMTDIFLKIVSMSLMAAYCVLLICIVRFPLRRAPKIFSYLLWSIVAVRLLCPFSLESNFSLVGEKINTFTERVATVELNSASLQTESSVDSFLSEMTTFSQNAGESRSPLFTGQLRALLLQIAVYVWLIGIAVLFGYFIVSYRWLHHRLKKKAFYCFDYKRIPVYVVEGLSTPFVLGFRRPAIYIPVALNSQEIGPCLSHEYTHISRKDHLIKQFAFLLACVYWFQPLVWLAFYLMTEDMEMSCDEIALMNANLEGRKNYSNALVRLSSEPKNILGRRFSGYPLAFGENNVSTRIKNILNLKKTTFWGVAVCGILLAVLAVGLLTDPVDTHDSNADAEISLYDPPAEIDTDGQSELQNAQSLGDTTEVDALLGTALSTPTNENDWTKIDYDGPSGYIGYIKAEYVNDGYVNMELIDDDLTGYVNAEYIDTDRITELQMQMEQLNAALKTKQAELQHTYEAMSSENTDLEKEKLFQIYMEQMKAIEQLTKQMESISQTLLEKIPAPLGNEN